MSDHQLQIGDDYYIDISNVKKLVSSFYDKESKYSLQNLKHNLRLGLKTKKVRRLLEIDQSVWLKSHIEFNTQKRIEAEKMGTKKSIL